MTEWQVVAVADIAAPHRYALVGGPFGSDLGRKDYVAAGVPVIRGAQLTGPSVFSHDDLVFVTEEKADQHLGNLAFPGDVIVTQRGTVGQVGRIPDDAPYPRYLLSQSQMKLTVDRSKADPQFVLYALLSPVPQQGLHGSTMSAGVPHINLSSFREILLPLPSIATQQLIGGVLGALDALIENNRRRIVLLEKMAQAIYQEWFVRFRYPGCIGAVRVDSALGPIPEGWKVQNLFDVAQVAFGFSFKSNRFGSSGPYPIVRIRDVPGGKTKTFSDEKPPDQFRIADGDVLIGMDGEFYLRQWTGGEAWLNQRVARLRPLGGLTARHLQLAIKRQIEEWNAAITGTTVAHLGKRHLEQIRIVVPSSGVLALASDFFAAATECELLLTQINCRLEVIRGLLLPRLVTGQIDVSGLDFDPMVESVG